MAVFLIQIVHIISLYHNEEVRVRQGKRVTTLL